MARFADASVQSPREVTTRPPSRRIIKWAEAFAETGNATEAAVAAGYKPTAANSIGPKLRKRFPALVEAAVRENHWANVPRVLKAMRDLATSTDDKIPPSVRLSAQRDWLDRSYLLRKQDASRGDGQNTPKTALESASELINQLRGSGMAEGEVFRLVASLARVSEDSLKAMLRGMEPIAIEAPKVVNPEDGPGRPRKGSDL